MDSSDNRNSIEEFDDTITIRWSDSKGEYTDKGGKNNLVKLPHPYDITGNNLLQILRYGDNERCRKVYGVGLIEMRKAVEGVFGVEL